MSNQVSNSVRLILKPFLFDYKSFAGVVACSPFGPFCDFSVLDVPDAQVGEQGETVLVVADDDNGTVGGEGLKLVVEFRA